MKFQRKIYVTSVNIYETLHSGAVVRILAKSPNSHCDEIFWTPQAIHIKRARKFSPKIKVFLYYFWSINISLHIYSSCQRLLLRFLINLFQKVKFPFDELRIEIDCSVSNSYVEIDAVEIVGGTVFSIPKDLLRSSRFHYSINQKYVSQLHAIFFCQNGFEDLQRQCYGSKSLHFAILVT